MTAPTPVPRRFISLGTKLAVVISCILLLISASLFFELTASERAKLIFAKTSAASMLTQLLATELAAAVDFGDADDLSAQLGHLRTNPDIAAAAIWSGASDAPTAQWATAGVWVGGAPAPSEPDGAVASPDWLVATRTVLNRKGDPSARLRVIFSLRPENDAFRASRRRLFWMTAGVTLATALLLALLARRYVVGPLRHLAEAAGAVADGDLSVRVNVDTTDEIGDLARAFNLMGKAVALRQGQVKSRNEDMQLVLDHVAQGLFTIDRAGVISPEHSRALADWLGAPRPGDTLWSYIERFDRDLSLQLQLGWEAIIDDVLPLALTLDQMPKTLRKGEQCLRFGYLPIMVEGTISKLLVVVSDVTIEIARDKADAAQRELLQVFEHFTKDRNGVGEFLTEADGLVGNIVGETELSVDVKRWIHTLKGNCAQFGLSSISELCHRLEGRIAETGEALRESERQELWRTWSQASSKVSTLRGDMSSARIEIDQTEYEQLMGGLAGGLPRWRLAQDVRRWRLEPMTLRLDRVARQARGLASRLGKSGVRVVVEPNGVRLSAREWAPFWSAFVHVLRNSLDHGIETEEERLATGKSSAGTLTIRTRVVGDEFVIEAADDGRGIDWAAIAARAGYSGNAPPTRKQVEEALFRGGVSTKSEVTEYSGRGIGMGAVSAACAALGGQLRVDSVRGKGTMLQFRFPTSSMGDMRDSLAPAASAHTAPAA